METLRQAGIRVTKGESKWDDEMVNMPAGVTLKNTKERYWKKCKKQEGIVKYF